MSRPRVYTEQQIRKAKQLYETRKYSLYKIADMLKFKSANAVLYYCDPKYRRRHLNRCLAIYRKNHG